jgi:hypothetical protein
LGLPLLAHDTPDRIARIVRHQQTAASVNGNANRTSMGDATAVVLAGLACEGRVSLLKSCEMAA